MNGRVRFAMFLAAGLVVALVLAFFVSPQASSNPDGLEKVATEKGIDTKARDHTFASSPTADYGVKGVDDEGLSTGLAGVLGVTVVFVLAGGLFFVVRRAGGRSSSEGSTEHLRV